VTRIGPVLVAVVLALAAAPDAHADLADEVTLAERYAPVLRFVAQEEECGYGEPYVPLDVDALLGNQTVALRGPWNPDDLVEIAPTAADLSRGLYEYHLDFPGDALKPGCAYERWSDRLLERSTPTVYAHVVADPGYPGSVALQYWFFYAFNDFNNKHEGDWELIQLVFGADDAAGALEVEPVEVGYSQHEGAEQAAWDDEKLERVEGTHPVVHPAAGSHANYFQEALYLGRSAEQGVGCDDTSSPVFEVRPAVETVPSDPIAARERFAWIEYEGRWGELQEAFFNGPTGPNLKLQWAEPIRWVEEDWRERSYAIPGGGALGTSATDFFCGAVRGGSDVLRSLIDEPGPTLVVLAVLAGLALFALTRTTWTPTTPLRIAHRRAWGQTLAAAARMYVRRWPLFVGIALMFLPITVVNTALQGVAIDAPGLVGLGGAGEAGGALATLAVVVGAALTLVGLALVQAATSRAVVEIDAGRPIGPLQAYRLALRRFGRLLGALAIAAPIVALLSVTLALVPIAVWLAGRWALLAQAVELEGASPLAALRRSSELVRGRWLKAASLVVAGAAIALVSGPVIGGLLIAVTDAPFALLNVVAGVVYTLAMPLVALTTTYVYFDAVVRERLEPEAAADELPAEI
jgi:hypothetical protein